MLRNTGVKTQNPENVKCDETQGEEQREECGETQRQCGPERPGHQQSCRNVKTPWEAEEDYNIANMPTVLFLESPFQTDVV